MNPPESKMRTMLKNPLAKAGRRPRMTVRLANHYGMCFGVRDAIRKTLDAAVDEPVTVLGQLVHNPVVDAELDRAGVRRGDLGAEVTEDEDGVVAFTAHGVSDRQRQRWSEGGRQVVDTTCPLVHKAHAALRKLAAAGYRPVVIGQPGHVEVEGLIGDFDDALVVAGGADIANLPERGRLGIVSQTTQPVDFVRALVERIRAERPGAEVKFIDTVCAPTKDRQEALRQLCQDCDLVVVVGGANSNNTGALARAAEQLGVAAVRVERAEDLRPGWFRSVSRVGVTAGTSTLDETVRQVFERLQRIAAGGS